MARKTFLTKEEWEKLPEKPSEVTRGDYSEHGDGYKLDAESVGDLALDNIGELRRAHERVKKELKDAKAKNALPEGFDLAQAQEALERVKALEGTEGKTKDQIEAVRKNLTDIFEKEKAKLLEQNGSLESQLQRHLVESAAALALGKEKADADLLMPHIRQSVQAVRGDDGKYALRVLNPDGSEALSKMSGKGQEPMSVDELVGSVFKARFPAAFPGSGAQGSGAQGSSRSGSAGGGKFVMSQEQARDFAAFERMSAEAAKAGQTVTIAS